MSPQLYVTNILMLVKKAIISAGCTDTNSITSVVQTNKYSLISGRKISMAFHFQFNGRASDHYTHGRLKEVLISDVLRHLFSLNKWQYRDEYIMVIVVLRGKIKERLRLKNCKKWREWHSNPKSPATMRAL